VEKIIQRINGWKEKLLSIGGKEILLKAVAQAIPVYTMSVFLIPKGVYTRMMNAIARFWLGDDENSKKNALASVMEVVLSEKTGWNGIQRFPIF
jgi:hypothetical protein